MADSHNPSAVAELRGDQVIPDVAALAGAPLYAMMFDGAAFPSSGGAGAATPFWASLVALIDAALPLGKQQRFRLPLFSKAPVNKDGFPDITSGNNASDPNPGIGYQAGQGSMQSPCLTGRVCWIPRRLALRVRIDDASPRRRPNRKRRRHAASVGSRARRFCGGPPKENRRYPTPMTGPLMVYTLSDGWPPTTQLRDCSGALEELKPSLIGLKVATTTPATNPCIACARAAWFKQVGSQRSSKTDEEANFQ
jgi:hypothetical protein